MILLNRDAESILIFVEANTESIRIKKIMKPHIFFNYLYTKQNIIQK